MRIVATLLLLSAVVASGDPRADQEDDIREAAFRFQFTQRHANAYYLCGTGKNRELPASFMKRFAGHSPPVRVCSAAHYDREKGLVDNKSRKPAVSLQVMVIKWISDTEVEVWGLYTKGKWAGSSDCRVKKHNGKWTATALSFGVASLRIYPTRSAVDGSIRAARRAGM